MTSLRDAATQALEALEYGQHTLKQVNENEWESRGQLAIDALRAALAEPVQEPVAWMVYTLDGKSVCVTDNPAEFTDEHRVLPLYTAPPQRKPLHDKQLWECNSDGEGGFYICVAHQNVVDFARAVERAHGIK